MSSVSLQQVEGVYMVKVLDETQATALRPTFAELVKSSLRVVALPVDSLSGETSRTKVMHGCGEFTNQESQQEGIAFLASVLVALSEELPRERLEQIQLDRLHRFFQMTGQDESLFEQHSRNNRNELRRRSQAELLSCGVLPRYEDHARRTDRPSS